MRNIYQVALCQVTICHIIIARYDLVEIYLAFSYLAEGYLVVSYRVYSMFPFLADLWSIILFRLEARLSEIFSSPKFFI